MADILSFKPRTAPPEESKIVVVETQQFYCPCGCVTFKILPEEPP